SIPAVLIDNQIIIGTRSFYFAYGCLGIRHLTLFAFFILFYFGRLKHKIIYILVGFVVLTFANVSRATIIGISIYFNPSWFDFVHEYGSMIVLYGTIFLLWIIWVKRIHIE
ncbi:MAG: archaeosortase/exosortase family protein, partial [Salinivirgaceae bacterium]|nr:archaeosortase/exosortase family protein [Salinivirgaceae bacterium]